MLLFAKVALGLGGTLALATAYTFHEGVIRIDVDEARSGGSHVHFWVPAAAVPMALHFAPRRHLDQAAEKAQPYLPMIHVLTHELQKYPDVNFIEMQDADQHVQIQTQHGRLRIDVVSPGESVHIVCPLETLQDVAGQIASHAPGV